MDRSLTHEREVRAARNQAMFRAVNEKIMELSDAFRLDGTVGIACECSDPHCTLLLQINVEAYESVRRSPRTFAVLPGHVDSDVERVIAACGNYAVVEMTGAAAVAVLERGVDADRSDAG
jgi:hypothetical protein